MDEENLHREVLRSCFERLIATIDPQILRAPLYQRGLITGRKMREIGDDCVRTRCAENLILYFTEDAPSKIKEFISVLCNPSYGYSFLQDELNSAKDNITRQQFDCSSHIYSKRKLKLFNNHRKRVIYFRHELKRLSHSGDIENFSKKRQLWIRKWKERGQFIEVHNKRQNMADMYFMALDAELEHRRVMTDKTLFNDNIFQEVKMIIVDTSEPTLTTMMYLARYGSAMVLAGKSLTCGLSYVEQALSHFDTIPACRETGIVLYVYFNMKSKEYEASPSQDLRDNLLRHAKEAISHFGREDELMGLDFRRMVLIKIALVYLGIGIFANDLQTVKVTKSDIKAAIQCLSEIKKYEMWSRMEARWKMFYYVAKAKIYRTNGCVSKAHNSARKALMYSKEGNFKTEGDNIKQTLFSYFSSDTDKDIYRDLSSYHSLSEKSIDKEELLTKETVACHSNQMFCEKWISRIIVVTIVICILTSVICLPFYNPYLSIILHHLCNLIPSKLNQTSW